MTKTADSNSPQNSHFYIVELDERLEFGAAIIDSDLQADDNTGCHNLEGCIQTNNTKCTNDRSCA